MKRRTAALLASLCIGIAGGVAPCGVPLARAATAPRQVITADVRAALAQMGTTLLAKEFSFRAHTLRVYGNTGGMLLHIGHDFRVTVRRPDRLLIDANGDDGPRRLIYDGKTVVLASGDGKHYAELPVPDTIERMMQVVMGRFGLDFPLADFLTNAPDKAFLAGVTSGSDLGTVTIDGVPCRHLVFSQPPGIELELWLETGDHAVPRRLIVTYNALPGKPNFIAEMSDWNFTVHPSDADFTFTPPAGAEQVPFGMASGEAHTGAPQ